MTGRHFVPPISPDGIRIGIIGTTAKIAVQPNEYGSLIHSCLLASEVETETEDRLSETDEKHFLTQQFPDRVFRRKTAILFG